MVRRLLMIFLVLSTILSTTMGCESNLDTSEPGSEESQPNVPPADYNKERFEVLYTAGAPIYNDMSQFNDGLYYLVDMTDPDCVNGFGNAKNVTYSYNKEGFVRFVSSSNDPYLWIESPAITSQYMKYLVIEYKASKACTSQIFVNRSDGLKMGDAGSSVNWNMSATTTFKKAVVDISSMCKDNKFFTNFRIDPSMESGVTVDIKYIAGFKSKADAEKFDYNKYINGDGYVFDTPVYKEMDTTAEDFKESTVKIADNGNGTVTISYMKNGKKVSSVVPNKNNYTSGGFAVTDDLGRVLPNSSVDGIYGDNGEFNVGLFYFMWMGEHGDYGVYDMNKIVQKYGVAAAKSLSCGAWGQAGAMHFWGEPLYGYYYSKDEWVIRKHMELLTNANVDFLYFDVTNGYPYIANAKKLMKICHDMNLEGFDAPQVVFYTHSASTKVVKNVYDSIYSKGLYKDTWFIVDGKPVIVAYEADNINNFFTIRLPQWPNEPANTAPSWPWMDFQWPQRVFQKDGVGESISVSIAQHSGSVRFSTSLLYGDSSNRGRTTTTVTENKSKVTSTSYKYGYNFQAQWNRVFDCISASKSDPSKTIKYVLVTGWNEWVAQRQAANMFPGEEVIFIDTISPEYSRDAEMTRGLYFDNYYLQLLYNIQKLKGAAPVIIQDGRKAINVTGDFSQWDDVSVVYKDMKGDAKERNSVSFGYGAYVNQTGRNDIVAAKVINDTKNIYFYVETAKNISEYDDSSWMQLFVNTNKNATDGWYGYDYIINYKAKDDFNTSIAKCIKKGAYSFETFADVSYRVSGNKMMIAVPLSYLGITDYNDISIDFKWADSKLKITNMEGFYELGDCAPLGRLNWVFRNK